jgi:cell wall-associated protease
MKIKTIIILACYFSILTHDLFCQTTNQNYSYEKKKKITEKELKDWYFKDFKSDTIPGVSLNKAYQEILKNKKGKPIIVAVIDTELDINHEDLKDAIWINKKEIPNNGIDDDKNGYVDDINGWNFLGNKRGESIIYQNTEATRIIKKLKKDTTKEPVFNNKKDSLLYIKALNIKAKDLEEIKAGKETAESYIQMFSKVMSTCKEFFPNDNYTIDKLDSLYAIYKVKDKTIALNFYHMKNSIKRGYSKSWFDNNKKKVEDKLATTFNDNYYDRTIIGDNEEDINDKYYGNNDISKNAKWTYHATQVSGLIAANRKNAIGINGFSDNIKIIGINAIPTGGSEHDKDVALGIRYAVDNGAKVINMSFGKTLSLHEDWVIDAMKYAEKKDVLLVMAACNYSENADNIQSYPIDYNEETGVEFCNNFISVGASGYNINENLPVKFSNYGKKNVDIFAPGYSLYTTDATSKYVFNDGTSLACAITSGTAALIRSHYPKLTAAQVKQIILDSGVSYNMEVIVPGTKDKKIKFSELSKSGKVVNVYNALLMVEKMSKKKK